MNTVEIPKDVAQAIHDYLMSRPMAEVEGLVVAIRRAKPLLNSEEKEQPA